VELIDLGLSQDLKSDPEPRPAGTLHAMSPEMASLYLSKISQSEVPLTDVTFASDFYTLGILAFELINGKPPHGYFDQS